VLFLGTTIAVLSITRVMLNMAKGSAFKQRSDGNFRAQAQAAVIAAIRRGDIAPSAAGRVQLPSRVPPVIFRSGYETTVQRNIQAVNQPYWLPARRRCAGYTVIELMSSLAVVAVLAGVSVP